MARTLTHVTPGAADARGDPSGTRAQPRTSRGRLRALIARLRRATLARELARVGPVYLGLAFVTVRLKVFLTPAWTDGTLAKDHEFLIRLLGTNNEQSRVLQFLLPEALMQVFGMDYGEAYAAQRLIFTAIAFMVFHGFLRRWFSAGVAFGGVALLAAVIPFTFFNHLQESAPALWAVYVAGLWAIRARAHKTLAALYGFGGFVNETMLSLGIVDFAYNVTGKPHRNPKAWLRAGLLATARALPMFAVHGTIRYITRHRPHLDDPYQLDVNLHYTWAYLKQVFTGEIGIFELYRALYLYPFLTWGLIWVFAFVTIRRQPLFLRRAAWLIPPFLIAHYITGVTYEARQMIPLGFILIPMAFFFLFPGEARVDRPVPAAGGEVAEGAAESHEPASARGAEP